MTQQQKKQTSRSGESSLIHDPLVHTPQICAELGCDRVTLWRWERDGLIPRMVRIGKNPALRRSTLEKIKDGHFNGTTAA